MRKSFRLIFTIVFICLIPALSFAQKSISELNSKDLRASLKLLGVEVFKYDFSDAEPNCGLTIYIEEYNKDSLLSSHPFNFGLWDKDLGEKEFELIAKVSSDTTQTYWLNLIHPKMQVKDRINVAPEFRNAHYWMEIEEGELEYDKKIPLLFYGQAWEDEIQGMKIRRFCWGQAIGRDMKNENLEKIEHMVLISYELKR
ncbi:DUF5041 domain-containing protein [Draconibacterium sediminis]|uniref:DUF5041 domain-containing protein n=1 Tax=Draconibacterium sediminis TaxID=1544798 RepID=A0A0D8J8T5_9BACT|nr:DUF5041 domain-containing protein [Draconibacterium sediminis]KJF42931.1 hypothetical protein LH29_16150 [Draconibacterium sediminis]